MNIVSFSGGKDSTAMLLMLIERGVRIDRVICVDTTKEFPAMYRHIQKVQAMIDPLRIEIVKIDFDYWFGEHQKTRGKNNNGRNIQYPLIDWKITEKQALEYCYSKGLDWEGLYSQFSRVSCWCCPLSRIAELRTLHDCFPELWAELEAMDKKSFRTFRSDCTVADLSRRFSNEQHQRNLF